MHKLSLLALAAAFAAGSVAAQSAPTVPPRMPVEFPPWDDSVYVFANDFEGGKYVKDPMVQEALAYVNKVADPALLAIKPSTHNPAQISAPTYNDNRAKTNYLVYGQDDVIKCPGKDTWGLTYDDGPSPENTPIIRNALKATNDIKATFFVLGSRATVFPELVKDSFTAGHEIAIHSWSHRAMTSMTNEQLVAEFQYTSAAIFRATGKVPTMYRPPFGDVDDRVRAIARALGYKNIMWTQSPNRDTGDSNGQTSKQFVDSTIANVATWFAAGEESFISLEHDILPHQKDIAVGILDKIKAAGTKFPLKAVPVGVCAGIAPYKPETPRPPAPAPTTVPTTEATTAPAPAATTTAVAVPDPKVPSVPAPATTQVPPATTAAPVEQPAATQTATAPGQTQPAEVPAPGQTQPAEVPAPGQTQPAEVPAPGQTQPAEVPAPGQTQPAEVPAPGETQPAEVPKPAYPVPPAASSDVPAATGVPTETQPANPAPPAGSPGTPIETVAPGEVPVGGKPAYPVPDYPTSAGGPVATDGPIVGGEDEEDPIFSGAMTHRTLSVVGALAAVAGVAAFL
ncbi:chitin deacetylase [Gaertneriomyces sp. JEL0708]|nr:chitin deacetylase [Gaertneriomyces sp. JEL0708]